MVTRDSWKTVSVDSNLTFGSVLKWLSASTTQLPLRVDDFIYRSKRLELDSLYSFYL